MEHPMQRATWCRTALLRLAWLAGAAVLTPTGASGQPVDLGGPEVGTAKIEGYIYVNMRTGEVVRTPAGPSTRRGGEYWRNDDIAGSCDLFMLQDLPSRDTAATGRVKFGSAVMDWGDLPGGASVNGFDIAYATDVGVDPTGAGVAGFDVNIRFLDDYDGELDPGGTGASGVSVITLQDIPGGAGPGAPQGWVYIVDLEGSGLEFNWGSANLNGDGLHDFGYSYSFDQNQAGAKGVAGPFLVRPFSLGGTGTATGSVDQLDWFNGGDDLTGYTGPIWFGGGSCPARPYASTYMTVYGEAAPQVVNAFGFEHTASGSATLNKIVTPTGPALVVSGLGGGPGDRVAVDVGKTHEVGMEMRIDSASFGDEHVIEFGGSKDGSSLGLLGSLTTTDDVTHLTIRPDFSPVGSTTFTAELYDQGALVARVPGQTQFELHSPEWVVVVILVVIIIIASTEEARMILQGGSATFVIGGMLIQADEIRMIPESPQAQVDHFTGIETYTSGIEALEIRDEYASVSGIAVSGVGDAALAPDLDRVTVSGVGMSGMDGLRLLPGPSESIDWALDPTQLDCPSCPDGRWLDVLTRGRFGGAPDQSLGTIRFTADGSDWRMNADYSAVGSATKRLIAYRDGVIVQQVNGFTGDVVGVVEDPPSGCGKGLAFIGGQKVFCYFPEWRPWFTLLTIPGHPPVLCDSLAVLAEAPSAAVGEISEVSLLASGIPEMIISGLTHTVFCPADLNGDGMVDFSDYLEFLNLYDAGDPRADFNGDGMVDFSDYLEFLNLYDAGC